LPAVPLLPRTITGPVTRLGAAAQNALESRGSAALRPANSPRRLKWLSEQRVCRLHHYYAQTGPSGPPVVLVPPLMLAAEVYDDAPSTSAVTTRREHGPYPWAAEYGAPARRPAGSSARSPTTCSRSRTRLTESARRPPPMSTSPATSKAGCSVTKRPRFAAAPG
jgi:hypothetical protein